MPFVHIYQGHSTRCTRIIRNAPQSQRITEPGAETGNPNKKTKAPWRDTPKANVSSELAGVMNTMCAQRRDLKAKVKSVKSERARGCGQSAGTNSRPATNVTSPVGKPFGNPGGVDEQPTQFCFRPLCFWISCRRSRDRTTVRQRNGQGNAQVCTAMLFNGANSSRSESGRVFASSCVGAGPPRRLEQAGDGFEHGQTRDCTHMRCGTRGLKLVRSGAMFFSD